MGFDLKFLIWVSQLFLQGVMKKISHANIHFDYGGHYSKEHEWISKNSLIGIAIKMSSLEDVTYAVLVDKICKKIGIDEMSKKLKLSYSQCQSRKEANIVDDEDVYVYLTSVDKDGFRPILRVELLKGVENNQGYEEHSRTEQRSSFGVNYSRVGDVENGGIPTIARVDEIVGEEQLQQEESIIGEHMENDVIEERNDLMVVLSPMDQNGNDLVVAVSPIDNNENDSLDSWHEIIEVSQGVEESQFVNEWEDGTGLEIDQEFSSKEAIHDLVTKAANENCFRYKTIKSDKQRVMLRCRQASEGCKWYLRVAKNKSSELYTVRVHRKMHSCCRSVATTSSQQKGTPRLVASVLHEDYPGDVETPDPKTILNVVKRKIGLDCSYATAWRGKKQHVSDVRGTPEKSYNKLYSYLYMLEYVNHGTVTSVELDEEKRFKYLFIALGATIAGFAAIRKVIVVDATFLKTVYGGMLIFATAQDPNHHHYPIAFGVIDSEKDVSWEWFFTKLKTVIPDEPGLVFISDRHQSIIKAVSAVYPRALHAHCIWHLSQNVRSHVKKDKDVAKTKFMVCAHAYTKNEFDREYSEFRSCFPKAVEYLEKSIRLEQWTRCHFKGDKYNLDTSNSAESLNSVFKKARKHSLLTLIDTILEKFAEWFNKHRKESAGAPNTSKLVPFVENEMHSRCADAAKLKVIEINSYFLEYNIIGFDGKTYLVDLKMKSCSCKCFDVDKYPCVHAIAAVSFLMRKEDRSENIHIHDLCSKYYLIENWVLAYCKSIYVVPHESNWSVPADIQQLVVLPPAKTKKKPGRTQEKRFPSIGEYPRTRRNVRRCGINLERWLDPEEGT